MSQWALQFCFTICIRSYVLHEFLTTVTFSTILLSLAKRWGDGGGCGVGSSDLQQILQNQVASCGGKLM